MQLSTSVNQTMTSEELATLLELRHDNVRQAAINLQSHGIITFTETSVKGAGRPKLVMHFDKRNSIVMAAKLNDALMASVVDRWIELEGKQQIPQTLPDALRLAADLAEEKLQLENQLALAAPKVQFVDSYVEASGSLGFRETCKLLHIKENLFRKFLLDHEIMYLLAGKLTPYAQHIDAGRFTVKTGENQTNGHAFTQNKFTTKGIQWIAGLWASSQIKQEAA
ncbi:Uncharacterized phage-encoded protein [Cedecea lapagei]|uniref:Uncharacterized phage-encoded protein n=1 Tax=Cedecea lapagei TaxID=158823 RepID=A0A3S5DPX5_9ENTR|nr:DNA-binding protein [Cedecea lapagei]VEC00026.1 Uncharacterized phage-encoded protein [Cedecea lapagei]